MRCLNPFTNYGRFYISVFVVYLFYISVFVAYLTFPISCPDITPVFHARPCGRFIEIQSNLWRQKLQRTNQGPNFLGGSFSNRGNNPIKKKTTPASQKMIFPQEQTHPFSHQQHQCYQTSQTEHVQFFQDRNQEATACLSHSTDSGRSDSSSEANSSSCHRSGT